MTIETVIQHGEAGITSQASSRPAWAVMVSFVIVSISFYVYGEWHNRFYGSFEEEYPFFRGMFTIFSITASLIAASRCLHFQKFYVFRIYAIILMLCLIRTALSSQYWDIDMAAKGRLLHMFPELCGSGTNGKAGAHSVVCYEYWDNSIRMALVVNPDDQMSRPLKDWPVDLKNELIGAKTNISQLDDCHFRKVKHIVCHIYYIKDGCYME